MRGVTRELVLAVWRALPWRAPAAGGILGLLIAGATRLSEGEPDPWLGLALLRTAALAYALGLAFLLDDPARHTTAAVPTRRALRTGLRLALVTPVTALWWTAVLFLVPSDMRPPAADVTLEAAAACTVTLAAAVAAIRLTDEPQPGPSVAAALLFTAVVAPLLLPHRWELIAWVGDPRWAAAHERWAWLLAGAVVALAAGLPEPVRRFQPVRRPRTRPQADGGLGA